MPIPRVSVVVPAHTRETRLSFALEALAQQTLPSADFEVIVVRSPAAAAQSAPVTGRLEVSFLDCPEASISAQRNLGWRSARAPYVAFTDDDCRPAPDWLERLLAAAAPDRLVIGLTETDSDERHLDYGIAMALERGDIARSFRSCNLLYPRALLERLTGFDEAIPGRGADTDLGLRAIAGGADAQVCEEAVVSHAVEVRSFGEALRRALRADGRDGADRAASRPARPALPADLRRPAACAGAAAGGRPAGLAAEPAARAARRLSLREGADRAASPQPQPG